MCSEDMLIVNGRWLPAERVQGGGGIESLEGLGALTGWGKRSHRDEIQKQKLGPPPKGVICFKLSKKCT